MISTVTLHANLARFCGSCPSEQGKGEFEGVFSCVLIKTGEEIRAFQEERESIERAYLVTVRKACLCLTSDPAFKDVTET